MAFATFGYENYRVKSADESLANSTTSQPDDELLMPIGSNEIWEVEYCIWAKCAAASVNLSFRFNLAAANRWRCVYIWSGSTAVQVSDDGTGNQFLSMEANKIEFIKGSCIVEAGGFGNNFNFRWAQQNSSATPVIVKAGSWIKGRRLS